MLRRGLGLLNLEKITFGGCDLNHVLFNVFLESLGTSACGKRMLQLSFETCEIGVERMRILADFLRRDSFPALETLDFYKCEHIGDEGIVALAEALQDAQRTFLRDLELKGVGMSDTGIRARRMGLLNRLCLSRNDGVSDEEGLIALVQAIDRRGLPELQEFLMTGLVEGKVTTLGLSTLVYAVIKVRGVPLCS